MRVARFRPSWLTFRGFAAFTTALTLTLVMLGVYTAATGSGLACSAQWPLCDNGLLPQTIPSFIEWFHRLVAMITGFFILGTALWAWRTSSTDRRTRGFATLAVVLLPLQISIGAVTVTLNGLLPSGYSPPTQGAHLLVALTIFTALVLTTLRAFDSHFDRSALERARSALVASIAVLPVSLAFSRAPGLFAYTPTSQGAFYGVSLALFASLVAATVWLGASSSPRLRWLSGTALATVFVSMILGRDLVFYTPTVRTFNLALFVVTGVLVGAATWLTHRRTEAEPGRGHRVAGD